LLQSFLKSVKLNCIYIEADKAGPPLGRDAQLVDDGVALVLAPAAVVGIW